jgi:sortase (surface protein transpeptidase)
MPHRETVGLNSPDIRVRLRAHDQPVRYAHRSYVAKPSDLISDMRPAQKLTPKAVAEKPAPIPVVTQPKTVNDVQPRTPRSFTRPALPRQSRSAVLKRQVVQNRTRRMPHTTSKTRVSVLLVTMACAVFVAGSYVSFTSWKTNKTVTAKVAVLSQQTGEVENDNGIPDESNLGPDSVTNYRVATDLPRLINIPKLDVKARVKRLGVKSNNELMAPANIFDAGWYDGSSKPGEDGAMLVDGHVSGPTKAGIFFKLGSLNKDDKISIERGDGKIFNYRVVKSEVYDYDKVDMAAALRTVESGKPGLNLITCSGRYDVLTNKYEQRLVVFAVLE